VQHKEAALKTEANNTQPPDTQLSKGDNFNIDNNVSTANRHLVDCENNEKALEVIVFMDYASINISSTMLHFIYSTQACGRTSFYLR